MDLKNEIKKDFWDVVNIHYEKECYTDAIKDACLYLIQLIQEKSEEESLDGEKLITNVFSEQKPKLLINNYQTPSEKDEQRGFGFIIRGIICAIRNPISHSREFKYSKNEADAILLFINEYILSRLDDSKEFGYVDNWYKFIFQDNDNDSKKYSDVLLNNIPKKRKQDLMIEIVNNIKYIDEGKFQYFINKLYNNLSNKEKEQINVLLNQRIIKMNNNRELRMFFNHFEPSIWSQLDKLVKIRIEEIVYRSIKEGKMINKKCNDEGSLGTWVNKWIEEFETKKEIDDLLISKLNWNEDEAEYVRIYFEDRLISQNSLQDENKVNAIHNGLKNGRIGYKKLLELHMKYFDDENIVVKEFKEDYENFTPKMTYHFKVN